MNNVGNPSTKSTRDVDENVKHMKEKSKLSKQ
jgi:hypothetical protein